MPRMRTGLSAQRRPGEYKTREAKQDRRHLIVMFTGLRPRDTYDFDGQSTQRKPGQLAVD